MDQESAEELLKKWPGLNELIDGFTDDMRHQFQSPWLVAKLKAGGPAGFKKTVAELLDKRMESMDIGTVRRLAAYALAESLYDVIMTLSKKEANKCE